MDSNLGVKWPCFGEYHCAPCNRKWTSSRSWKLHGQKCTGCEAIIQATNLQQLFRYYCCLCKKLWSHKWESSGAPCRDCGVKVKAFKTHAEFKKAEAEYNIRPNERLVRARTGSPGRSTENSKTHRTDLCEKCTKTGINCKNGLAILQLSQLRKPEAASAPAHATTTALNPLRPANQLDFAAPAPLPPVNPWNRMIPPPAPVQKPPPSTEYQVITEDAPEPTPALEIEEITHEESRESSRGPSPVVEIVKETRVPSPQSLTPFFEMVEESREDSSTATASEEEDEEDCAFEETEERPPPQENDHIHLDESSELRATTSIIIPEPDVLQFHQSIDEYRPQRPLSPIPELCESSELPSCPLSTNLKGPMPNGFFVNGNGLESQEIPKCNGYMNGSAKFANGVSDCNGNGNGMIMIDYSFNRQNRHADERSLNLWNCTIQ